MYVLGHVGISLLLYAPLAAALLSTGQPAVAALTGLLMIVLAPLPDLDTYTDRLAHRGPTHTVWFALGVGLTVALVAGLGTVAIGVVETEYIHSRLLSPVWVGTWFGAVSTLAICGHLAGDLITPMGLWPFRPVSEWHHTFDLTPSKSPRANRFCFGVGVVALVSAVGLTLL